MSLQVELGLYEKSYLYSVTSGGPSLADGLLSLLATTHWDKIHHWQQNLPWKLKQEQQSKSLYIFNEEQWLGQQGNHTRNQIWWFPS